MGIRFKCHHCHAPLNIKSELAFKRGVCPECHGKFRIPHATQEFSLSLDVGEPIAVAESRVEGPQVNAAIKLEKSQAVPNEAAAGLAIDTAVKETAPVEELYFVRPPSGGEYGPASKETIEMWIAQRRVTAETMVCLIGTSQWRRARDVFADQFRM